MFQHVTVQSTGGHIQAERVDFRLIFVGGDQLTASRQEGARRSEVIPRMRPRPLPFSKDKYESALAGGKICVFL